MRHRALVMFMVVIGCVVTGYLYWRQMTSGQVTLRLGYGSRSQLAPYWVASEKGFFRAEGLNVTLLEFRSASRIIEALAAGSLDMGSAGLMTASVAIDNGVDLMIATDLGHTDKQHEGSFIAVRKDSGMQSLTDLKGKTIALNVRGSLPEMVVVILLRRHNLTIEDVNIVTIANEKQPEALIAGSVDAAYLVEPFLTYALETGECVKLCPTTSAMFPDARFQVTTTVFLRSYLAQNEGTVRSFIRAYGRAIEWMSNHPEETRDIVAEYTGLDTRFVARMYAYAFSEQLDGDLVDRCLRLMLDEGFLKKRIMADDIMYQP